MIFLWIITSIIIFSIIVLVHEYWHFKSARIFWVRVEEFWLGIPPRAKKLFKDKKWTLFSLNWLPLWWFVKLTWESLNTFYAYDKSWRLYNNKDLEKDLKAGKKIFSKNWETLTEEIKEEILKKLQENNADYNLINKPYWQQAIIILAWVFMNFLLAIFIFSILFFVWIKPIWINTRIETDLELRLIPNYEQSIESWLLIKNKWLLLNPIENSLSYKAWIINWDILKKINSIELNNYEKLKQVLKENKTKTINMEIEPFCPTCLKSSQCEPCSKSKIVEINLWEDWKIWAYISPNIQINEDFKYQYGLLESIKYWTIETYNQSLLTFKALGILVKKVFNPEKPSDRQDVMDSIAWPIWIVNFISNSLQAWIIFLIIIWAIISINLWVFNLLPIPALDWWRFIFILINGVILRIFWKRAISQNLETMIHVWFLIFLIALSIFIWYNDLNKILNS